MARTLFECQITDDDVLAAWRDWLEDSGAELTPALVARLDQIPAGFVAAAMSDAALTMIRVLLVDQVLNRAIPGEQRPD